MKQNTQQKGFSVVIALIVIAVVAALGIGSWYVWDKNQKDDSTNKSDKTSQNGQHQNEEEPSDPSEGGKYLVIKEWGVRFALPEDIRGDIYYRLDRNDILKAEFASFASNRLDELASNDTCTFKDNPQNSGLSARLLRGYSQELDSNPEEFKLARERIAEYNGITYYSPVIKPDSATCATAIGGNDPIPGLYDTEQEISQQLREALTTLETVEQ